MTSFTPTFFRLTCVAVSLCGAAATAAPAAVVALDAAQVKALGIQAQALTPVDQAPRPYPATLVIPPHQQRVVAAAGPGLIVAVSVSGGERVSAGQVLGQLRSAQGTELLRDVSQSGHQLELARRQHERDQQLFQEGLIAQSRLETSQAQWRSAQAQSRERQQALQQLGGTATADGVITLRAPLDGLVIEQQATVGQRVEAATPLWRVARLDRLWVDTPVPVGEAARVKLGDGVQVLQAGQAMPVQGRVIQISPVADATTQTVTVRALLPNANLALRPGQLIESRLLLAPATGEAVFLVPQAAVLTQAGGGSQVFVEEAPGRYRLQGVRVQGRQDALTAVSGLPPSTRIVVQGLSSLKALHQP